MKLPVSILSRVTYQEPKRTIRGPAARLDKSLILSRISCRPRSNISTRFEMSNSDPTSTASASEKKTFQILNSAYNRQHCTIIGVGFHRARIDRHRFGSTITKTCQEKVFRLVVRFSPIYFFFFTAAHLLIFERTSNFDDDVCQNDRQPELLPNLECAEK